jgi:hypothetical protein
MDDLRLYSNALKCCISQLREREREREFWECNFNDKNNSCTLGKRDNYSLLISHDTMIPCVFEHFHS